MKISLDAEIGFISVQEDCLALDFWTPSQSQVNKSYLFLLSIDQFLISIVVSVLMNHSVYWDENGLTRADSARQNCDGSGLGPVFVRLLRPRLNVSEPAPNGASRIKVRGSEVMIWVLATVNAKKPKILRCRVLRNLLLRCVRMVSQQSTPSRHEQED